jgi:tetratricopeptide (TPR) repeat protein
MSGPAQGGGGDPPAAGAGPRAGGARRLEAGDALRLAAELERRGELDRAEALYKDILRALPDHADGLFRLGVLALRRGRREEAVRLLAGAVELRPDWAEAHDALGVALKRLGRLDEAVACYRKAIALQPGFAGAYSNLGNALGAQGRTDEAVAALRRAVALEPRSALALSNLGNVLTGAGSAEEAAAACRRAIGLSPGFASAHSHLGNALVALGRAEDGLAAHREAVALEPGSPQAHGDLGMALKALGRLPGAEAALRHALELDPAYAQAHNNLGVVMWELGRLEEAAAAFRRSLELKPDWAEAHMNLALVLLLQGELVEGFGEYAWGEQARLWRPPGGLGAGWDGGPFPGRTLLLEDEQGAGHTIQFARFVPLARARGGRIILRCRRPLERLLRSLAGADDVVSRAAPPPAYEVAAPLSRLPGLLGTELDGIPAEIPYLAPDPEAAARWRDHLGDDGRLKVGLAWAGNPRQVDDRNRSMPFDRLAPLLGIPGVRFFGLQVGERAGDLAGLAPGSVEDLAPRLIDYAQTAAAIAGLDLVITVDTSVAHLAGALGRPVWVMLAFVPAWMWLMGRDDSPWYPTARLFRQPERGDWDGVVARVRAELEAHAAGDRSRLGPGL